MCFNDEPINFNFEEKINSQNISPIQRISWSITAWKRASFLAASETGFCATYAGKVEYFCLSQYSSHVIKTKEDLKIAEALLPLIEESKSLLYGYLSNRDCWQFCQTTNIRKVN